ncbi:MAG: hypothetical protein KAJ19_07580, partial [Gammaproteobacteria bacterium]|nr:hypothetical protein [Gammaproteobacteria bacterium]
MTEKTFTIEQIEKAAIKLAHTSLGDEWVMEDLIAALTEPEFKPEDTQCVVVDDCFRAGIYAIELGLKYRPLNQTEVGPDWVPRKDHDEIVELG